MMWALTGFSALIVGAIYRLGLMTLDAFEIGLEWYHWPILMASIAFMAYAEGYRGFQKQFSPRFAARVRHLRDNPRLLDVLLAPLFCMGYYYTTRRRLISIYVLTTTIVAFIIGFQYLTQPLRGLFDAGVVIGLAWGMVSIVYYCSKALTDTDYNFSPELPLAAASNEASA
tara:strand:+ start:1241 stop:1753 length:513 start_codon:yes stop_codon:yes gene_type:complete